MKIKKIFKSGIQYLLNKNYRVLINSRLGFYNSISDEEYLKKLFKVNMKKELNLKNPKTFNEKLQWLKLYNRKPEYTMMVDKYKVREYIKRELGEEYLIPLIGVWEDPNEINFDKLPQQFVLKCNHNSGLGMCICKDKSKLNIEKVKKDLRKGLNQDYYLSGREWPYKNVPRKIICEKFMVDSNETEGLTDYKFFCFNGYVDCVMVAIERHTGNPKFYFFDKDWNLLRYNKRGKEAKESFTLPMPKLMPKMFKIAEKFSKELPYARIDLYSCNDKIYFGEITFFPDSGFDANILPETDKKFGDLIKLENIKGD